MGFADRPDNGNMAAYLQPGPCASQQQQHPQQVVHTNGQQPTAGMSIPQVLGFDMTTLPVPNVPNGRTLANMVHETMVLFSAQDATRRIAVTAVMDHDRTMTIKRPRSCDWRTMMRGQGPCYTRRVLMFGATLLISIAVCAFVFAVVSMGTDPMHVTAIREQTCPENATSCDEVTVMLGNEHETKAQLGMTKKEYQESLWFGKTTESCVRYEGHSYRTITCDGLWYGIKICFWLAVATVLCMWFVLRRFKHAQEELIQKFDAFAYLPQEEQIRTFSRVYTDIMFTNCGHCSYDREVENVRVEYEAPSNEPNAPKQLIYYIE